MLKYHHIKKPRHHPVVNIAILIQSPQKELSIGRASSNFKHHNTTVFSANVRSICFKMKS